MHRSNGFVVQLLLPMLIDRLDCLAPWSFSLLEKEPLKKFMFLAFPGLAEYEAGNLGFYVKVPISLARLLI